MSMDSGGRELPPPQILSLAIRRSAETGKASDSLAVLDQIDREAPARRMVLAKFGFKNGPHGYDSRVYVLPKGQKINRNVDVVEKGKGLLGRNKKTTTTVEDTLITVFTPVGTKQIIIDGSKDALPWVQRKIDENLVLSGPNESKRGIGNEVQEKHDLDWRGGHKEDGMLNPNGTELMIGGILFTGDEIIHKPPKEALQDALRNNNII